jgi:hypothetical protein
VPMRIINPSSPLLSAFCLLPPAFCLLFSASSLLPSAFCLLLSAFCLLLSVFRLLLSAFCLSLVFLVDNALSLRMRQTIRRDPIGWASTCGINLRPYQRLIALAIKESILHNKGLTFVVVLPRQSGKNELQAHLFAWLLFRYAHVGGRIVSVSPTFKPQTTNNMDRVCRSLDASLGSRGRWHSSKGYMYLLGKACVQFFSGDTQAKVVGATADLLLSVDEAQEVDPAKFDKDFDPMTASTNATRVFWGTAWTSGTLLERQRRIALQSQQKDGLQRLFFFTADDVRRLVPAYGEHVDRVISERGRNHPLVRTQYFCETIDAQSGMFNPARLSLLFPSSVPGLPSPDPGLPSPAPGLPSSVTSRGGFEPPSAVSAPRGADAGPIAFLLDVAGMDESNTGLAASLLSEGLGNPGRDSTTLTIVSIDLSTLPTLTKPTYRVLARQAWTGQNHLAVFGQVKNLAEQWSPQHIVIDATGVGEGLWAMLDRTFPTRVKPVKFTSQEKSEIGWRFLSIIETGRFIDPHPTDEVRLQYSRCISEILPGPARHLRWGVPDGSRGPDGELIHDDYILADSLTAVLDRLEWNVSTEITVSEGFNPLEGFDSFDSSNRFYVNRF